jgi:hypothetical protein
LIQNQLERERIIFENDGRWQLVTKPTYRRRLILAFLLFLGGQNVGIIAINNYNVLLYQSLGLSNAGALAVSAAWNTVGWIANMIGATISDKVGRRNALGEGTLCCIEVNSTKIVSLVYGFAGNVATFIIATGFIGKYAEDPRKGFATVATVFLFFYILL